MVERFAFGLDYHPLLHTHGADRFRYREQEVMDCLACVIDELQLAPVVLWQRESRPMFGPLATAETLVAQLWER